MYFSSSNSSKSTGSSSIGHLLLILKEIIAQFVRESLQEQLYLTLELSMKEGGKGLRNHPTSLIKDFDWPSLHIYHTLSVSLIVVSFMDT